MESLWRDSDVSNFQNDLKQLRVYTSRLLGKNKELVLFGGGNTSVKLTEKDFFGNDVDLLYVKGSGIDLANIDVKGFSPLRIDSMLKLADLDDLSDADFANQQRCGLLDSHAPDVSVEALLHAVIPHRFVDHTHADSVIAVSSTPNGEERTREIFGDRVLVIPYVKPGFALARHIRKLTREIDWNDFDALVLMNHGLVTFHENARDSYELTIDIVTKAEKYLDENGANNFAMPTSTSDVELTKLAELRKTIARTRGSAVVTTWDRTPSVVGFSSLENIDEIATKGPLTPDHSIHTKRIPMIWHGEAESDVADYAENYQQYFKQYRSDEQTCLEPAPRWIIWPDHGVVAVGESFEQASVIAEIAEHTAKVVQQSEGLGGWTALSPKEIFDVEYWSLEQAKLKNDRSRLPLQGKIALVTGAANGIGLAATRRLHDDGACVLATDINPNIMTMFDSKNLVGQVCDVCSTEALNESVNNCVALFGGLDIVVSNAGVFSQGSYIDKLNDDDWQRSLNLNLSQHKNLMQHSYPFLKRGIDPTFIVIGTKNVAAPGPGASAYSVAKAGLNQLTRVAALEWGGDGIRVNIVHPDCVFDTELWAGGVLEQRAKKYEMTVEEYMSRNVLKTPVKSSEVAGLISCLAGNTFAKTTGAQFPIDGGNDRVI